MKNLQRTIEIAEQAKPSFAAPCNHCGWCCLTEVCSVGKELTGGSEIPCKLLRTEGDKHYCQLAAMKQTHLPLAIGQGCDAKTQNEIIKEIIGGE